MTTSESIQNISKSIVKCQSELTTVKFNRTNPYFNSKYADLASIWDMIRPVLAKNELAVIQPVTYEGDGVIVNTILVHTSGEWISFDGCKLHPEKNTPQGVGTAITYGRRYLISSILGIVADDDNDGNSPQDKTKPETKPEVKKPQETKPEKKTDPERQAIIDRCVPILKQSFFTDQDREAFTANVANCKTIPELLELEKAVKASETRLKPKAVQVEIF